MTDTRSDTVSVFNGPPPDLRTFNDTQAEVAAVAEWISGRPKEGVAPQLKRIAKVVVQASQDDVHRLQAAQQLEEDAVAADCQVAPLDEGVAEVLGQESVLEVGFVVRPRC